MNYFEHILIMLNLYVILGLTLNLVIGYGGLLSLCHGAFYGIGAYATTLLMMKAGWGFVPAVTAGVVVTGIAATLIGIPALRLKGDSFVLGTMGFQIIVFSILYNCAPLTSGPYGIPGIPKPVLFGWRVDSITDFLILSSGAALVVALLHWQQMRSPFGRALQAVRDDELAARALGKNPTYFRLTTFVFSAGLASLAGAIYACYVSYIDPTSFGIDEAIFAVTVVVIGGAGNLVGPIVGAAFMVLLPEALRFLHIPDTLAPSFRQIIYGLLLILVMRFRPKGIAGRYAFD